MLRKNLGLVAVMAVSMMGLTAVACGGDDDTGTAASGGAGGSGATGGAGGSGATGGTGATGGAGGAGGGSPGQTCEEAGDCVTEPPPPTNGTPASGTTERVIAVSQLFLGTTDRDGNAAATAWKDFGFDLDGLKSTRTDTNHCAPVAGASPAAVKTDGNGGRDNSFGANLVTLIDTIAGDAQGSINDSISAGDFTIMVRITNYTEGADVTGLNASLYGGAALGATPAWDGTDAWPVFPELLNGTPPDINDPKVVFANAYTSGGTFVAGGGGATLTLSISIQGFSLALTINEAVIAMDIGATGATNGTIGGVIETETLISEIGKVAGTFDPSLCPGSGTFDSIANQIRAGSDIMDDGTNGDSSQTCNAISVGLGFNGSNVTLGAVADAAVPGPDPCAP